MIKKLLDDFYHVEQACYLLSIKPFDRPLVNLLHCMGGESVTVSRWIGLIIMVASMFVFIRFLHSGKTQQSTVYLFTLVHPIILFPCFYASQLSSAVTVAWAIGGVSFFFHKCKNMAWVIAGSFLLALVGLGVRFEAVYILTMVIGSVLILFQSWHNLTIIETVKKYFHQENLIKVMILWGSFLFIKIGLSTYFVNAPSVLWVIINEQADYPLVSWYNSQVVAVLHYLQNFAFPFSHSFYGNWQEYVWMTQTFDSFFPMVIFLFLVLGLFGWSYRSQRLSPNIRLLIRGVVMFVLIALAVSSVPRSEWYYPIRGHLAAVVLMGYVSVFVSRLKYEKMISIILAIYLTSSMGYAVLFQYKNIGNMYDHDQFFYGDVHPFLRTKLANREWDKGNREVALQTWFNIYQRIPRDIAVQSNRAAVYKLMALYNGWWAYEMSDRHQESFKLLPDLLNNRSFISAAVCLQDARVEIEKCLDNPEKINNFCMHWINKNFPDFKQAHPFRIDVDSHCRKLGYNPFY